eukprot:231306-Pelagomonas_calceolata.AAC.1
MSLLDPPWSRLAFECQREFSLAHLSLVTSPSCPPFPPISPTCSCANQTTATWQHPPFSALQIPISPSCNSRKGGHKKV